MSITPFPRTVKVIQIQKHGGPEVIEKLDAPFSPSENDIVIKVEYAGVNFIDTYHRAGLYQAPKFPFTIGQEVAGVIVALPTSLNVVDNPEYQKRGFQIGDGVCIASGAGFAEYLAHPWTKVIKLPPGVDTKTAAAIALQGLTALTAIKEAYEVKKGDFILVHAAAGGLGSLMTQVGVYLGATVIAIVSSDAKAEVARANGAQHILVIPHNSTPSTTDQPSILVKEVLRITDNQGVHGIFDGVGKDTFEDNFLVARRKGTIVSLGNASGVVPPFPPLKLSPKNLKLVRPVLGNYIYTPEELLNYSTALFDLVATGAIKVSVHKEYPFTAEGVQQSQIDITGRGTTGKLIINFGQLRRTTFPGDGNWKDMKGLDPDSCQINPCTMSVTPLPQTVKVIQIQKHGGPEVIEMLDAPLHPFEGDIVIKVQYAGVNFVDTYHRSGTYQAPKFPFTIGQEVAGVIVALPTSPNVVDTVEYRKRGFQVGDRVFIASGAGFAEYVAHPWPKVIKLPPSVDTKTGAAIAMQGLAALTAVKEAHKVKKDDFILVHTAAGGFGSLITQAAVHLGAIIIAVVSSDMKAEVAKANGAQHVLVIPRGSTPSIVDQPSTLVKEVLRITDNQGVHGIFDGVGKDTFEDNFLVARRKGTIVSLGNASGIIPPFPPLKLLAKNLKLVRPCLGNYIYTQEEILHYSTELFDLVAKGAIKVSIHKEYPFTAEGVQQSQIDMASRETTGKLIINFG